MDDVVELVEDAYGVDRRSAPHGPWRGLLRSTIHFFSYNFILKRRTTRVTRAAGFRLIVRPTVFHPRYFITSEFFASYIGRLDFSGKRVVDVGTGSGILALAAARAGAASVTAVDINANAVLTAAENARANRAILPTAPGMLARITATSPRFSIRHASGLPPADASTYWSPPIPTSIY